MGINVLSLFDGISAGQLALQRTGVKVDNYYASEIDKYAIQITQKNFPVTIQLGDINDWKNWKLPKIDLIIGGSPCQGFSIAGKGLNFDDPKSKLFFIFCNILKCYDPEYFLLENVKMRKEWQDIITNIIGVEPIEINSALVSAQSRKRLYWTNIPNITQPINKNILLKNIVENISGKEKIINKEKYNNKRLNKECFQIGEANIKGFDMIRRVYSIMGKSPSLTSCQGGQRQGKISLNNETWRGLTPIEFERLQTFPDNYTMGISNSQRYKCIGNSWTVNIIIYMFSFLPNKYKKNK